MKCATVEGRQTTHNNFHIFSFPTHRGFKNVYITQWQKEMCQVINK